MAEDTFTNVADTMAADDNLRPILDIIERIMALDENNLSDDAIEVMKGMLTGAFTENIKKEAIDSIVQGFHRNSYTRVDAQNSVREVHTSFDQILTELHATEKKEALLKSVFDEFCSMFDSALDRYLIYDIVLPIKLDKNGKLPTYAHLNDAAADLFAAETITLPAHSLSNMIHTGVHLALPEGWMAMIFPRSSIGAKTGLRLSNSAGIIDNTYTGELGVLYDNLSDSDYTITEGDRIAQLMVLPSYHFKPQTVDILPTTDRNDDGFGSTGK